MFTPRTRRRRIRRIWDAATPADRAAGLEWYPDANNYAADLADLAGLEVAAAAGIIAALSPMTEWEQNKRRAHQLVTAGTCPGLSHNVTKAQQILAGQCADRVLGGLKVRSFARNIADPTDPEPVTVDRHAWHIANGPDSNPKQLERVGIYDAVADDYRTVADSLGVLPAQVQAVTWVVWRQQKQISI